MKKQVLKRACALSMTAMLLLGALPIQISAENTTETNGVVQEDTTDGAGETSHAGDGQKIQMRSITASQQSTAISLKEGVSTSITLDKKYAYKNGVKQFEVTAKGTLSGYCPKEITGEELSILLSENIVTVKIFYLAKDKDGKAEEVEIKSGNFELESGDTTEFSVSCDVAESKEIWAKVLVNDSVVAQTTEAFSVVIPKDITYKVEISNFTVTEACNHEEDESAITSHQIKTSGEISIEMSDVDENIKIEEREAEIIDDLSEYELYIKDSENTENIENNEDTENSEIIGTLYSIDNDIVDGLITEEKKRRETNRNLENADKPMTSCAATISFEENNYQVKQAGTYTYTSQVRKIGDNKLCHSCERKIVIDKLEQKFEFATEDKIMNESDDDKTDRITFANTAIYSSQKNSIHVGDFSCKAYTGTGNNQQEASEKDIVIKSDGDNVYVIPKAIGAYTLKFTYSGNELYKAKSQEVNIEVKKAVLDSTLEVNVQETGKILKRTKVSMTATLTAQNGEMFDVYDDNVTVTFQIVPEDESLDTVEFINLKPDPNAYEETRTLSYTLRVDEEKIDNLVNNGKYSIRAIWNGVPADLYKIEYTKDQVAKQLYDVQNVNIGIQVNNPQLIDQIETDTTQTIDVTITPERESEINKEKDYTYEFSSDNTEVLTIDPNTGTIQTSEKKGTATIMIQADDAKETGKDVYNHASLSITVSVVSPKDIGYTVTAPSYDSNHNIVQNTYQSVEELYHNTTSTVASDKGTEYWYCGKVTITPNDKRYTHVAYRKKNADGTYDGWNYAEEKWEIEEEALSSYEFFFCDGEAVETDGSRIDSRDWMPKQNGQRQGYLLENIGIDTKAPNIANELVADTKASNYSTNDTDYFSQNIAVIAYASDDGSMDKQSGIGTVERWNSNNNTWEELKENVTRDIHSYTVSVEQGKDIVRLRFTDNVGHQKEVVYRGSYQNGDEVVTPESKADIVQICVDTVRPVVSAKAVIADGTNAEYKGDWTNQPISYTLHMDDEQLSGIHEYQYVLVPRGTTFSPETVEWQKLEPGDLDVTIGTLITQSKQKEIEAEFIYPDDTQVSTESNEVSGSATFNGTIYFRAESNAGLFSGTDAMNANKKEVRIWQQQLDQPKVYADKHAAKTGWYNKETGEVNVTFSYPDYNKAAYAPAIGLEIEVTTVTINDEGKSKSKTEERVFYQGIFDESTGVVQERTGKKLNSKGNLATDGTITVATDCKKIIKVTAVDMAGNKSDVYTYTVNGDFTVPEVEKITFTAAGESTEQKLHVSQKDVIKYNVYTNTDMKVKADVEYGISGQKKITMQPCKEIGDWSDDSSAVKGSSLTIKPDTRGFIYLTATDKAGNTKSVWTDGYIVEDQKPIGDKGKKITIVAGNANSLGFYNKDIPISVHVTDSVTGDDYSGLKEVNYTVGYEGTATKNEKSLYYFSIKNPTWKQIVKAAGFSTNEVVIDAQENESNEAYLTVNAIDNAGNKSTITKKFQIDVTKPVIEISYDSDAGERGAYFNKQRTATIQITEKNFDAKRVAITVYRDDAVTDASALGGANWVSSGDVHTATLTFAEEGDYKFTVDCTDMADNKAIKQESEEFTIDLTKPVVEVTYDNNEARHENYFNSARTATVTVEEHNFDAEKFKITATPGASVSGWSGSGDVHTATVHFSEDEHYTVMVTGEDMAGNPMEAFEEQDFYIDTTEPEISISGVENSSANAGTVVPVVHAADKNYDVEGMTITLTDSKGNAVALSQKAGGGGEEYSYTLTNVDEQPDEIYTLKVLSTDMAGNEAEMEYRFSLNRDGSTYDLSDMKKLMNNVYTSYDDMDDLQVVEMNVDTIEDFSIYVSKNGEMHTKSEEGSCPSTLEENVIYYEKNVKGDATTGYEYTYTIYKENFEGEGIYNIMFYSKDRAGNEVNNTLDDKGAEINFVVDNSAPTVVIDGVEAGEFYAEDSKDVNVCVSDNFSLKKADFYLVDEDGNTVETYDYLALADEMGDVVTLSLPNNEKKLSLTYNAVDEAGNGIVAYDEGAQAPANFMITTNAWLQFINSRIAVITATCAGGMIVIVGGAVAYRRRRKARK